jgi:carbonic anhydrase
MPEPEDLFARNRAWASGMLAREPDFFARLSNQQAPEFLWIGCADSRVPANEIVGLMPGELFVHRNVANVVPHADLNCASVIQFAVDILRVRHVIVCGHYGCGGVQAVLSNARLGLVDLWLRHVREVAERHEALLAAVDGDAERLARLCELNVIEQVRHVARSTILQDAWARGQSVAVHGWIYGVGDGLLRDLATCVRGPDDIESCYRAAVGAVSSRQA